MQFSRFFVVRCEFSYHSVIMLAEHLAENAMNPKFVENFKNCAAATQFVIKN